MSSQDPNLDAESRQTLNVLRKDIWTGGGVGLGIGFLAGLDGLPGTAVHPQLAQVSEREVHDQWNFNHVSLRLFSRINCNGKE